MRTTRKARKRMGAGICGRVCGKGGSGVMHVKQIKQTNQCWGLQLTNYGAANKQPVPAHAWCSEARLPPCAPCTHHVVADHVRQRGQQRPGRHGLLALLQRRPAHLIPLLEVVLLQLLPAPASSAERGREVAQVSMVTQRKAELQQQSSTRREAASNHAATHLYLFFRLLPPPSAAVAARRCRRLLQIADRGVCLSLSRLLAVAAAAATAAAAVTLRCMHATARISSAARGTSDAPAAAWQRRYPRCRCQQRSPAAEGRAARSQFTHAAPAGRADCATSHCCGLVFAAEPLTAFCVFLVSGSAR